MASAANHKATNTHEEDDDSIEEGLMIGIELQQLINHPFNKFSCPQCGSYSRGYFSV